MPVPYQTAVEALRAESARVEMISNNLVNASSHGFKRGLLTSAPFANSLSTLAAGSATGHLAPAAVSAVATDFAQGPLTETGNVNHLAIVGSGFFEVRSGTQVLYTRSGAFRRDESGRLVNAQGMALQGEGGDIVAKTDRLRIERDGTVLDGDHAIGRLRVWDFPNKAGLQRMGGSGFDALGQLPVAATASSVRQGFLEASNVTSSTEMVQLMEAMKRFEFGQRIVQSQDDMMDRAIRRIGEGQ